MAEIAQRVKLGSAPIGTSLRRFVGLPNADLGKAVAHIGFGALIVGVSMVTAYEHEDIRVVREGDTFDLGGYTFSFKGVTDFLGPNYAGERAQVIVTQGGTQVAELYPEKRFYTVQRMPTTEAAIQSGFTRDLYVSLGELQTGGGWAMRTYVKPFVSWIWMGSIIMSLGGLVSLTDRRYRVGVGARRTPPAGAVPAE